MALSIDNEHILTQDFYVAFKRRNLSFYLVSIHDMRFKKIDYTSVCFKADGRFHYKFEYLTQGFLLADIEGKYVAKKIGEHDYIALSSNTEKDVHSLDENLVRHKLPVRTTHNNIWIYKCDDKYFEVDDTIFQLKKDSFRMSGTLGETTLEDVTLDAVTLDTSSFGAIALSDFQLQNISLNTNLPTVSYKEL